MVICLTLFVLMMVSLAMNKVPMGVTGLATLAALVIFKCIEAKDALSCFGNANVIIIVGMFVVGAGLRKTTLIGKITEFIRKVTGGNFKFAYRGVIILAILLTSILTSPAVCFAIVFPIMDSICDEFGVSRSKVHFPLGMACIACCGILPFGFAISQAAVFSGLMETYGFTQSFTALEFTKGRWSAIVLVILWAFFIAPKYTLEKPATAIVGMEGKKAEGSALSTGKDWLGSLVFILTILALIFNSQLGLASWLIVLTGCVLLLLFGVLTSKEAINAMPFDIGFMFIGANAMASALVNTGTADLVGAKISELLGSNPSNVLLAVVFFVVPFILTQFMNNQAVMNIFAPICLLTCKAIGADPRGLLILICSACLTAFMTPSATAAIPMVMGAGGYDVKSLTKMGWLFAVLVAVMYVAYVTITMPAI